MTVAKSEADAGARRLDAAACLRQRQHALVGCLAGLWVDAETRAKLRDGSDGKLKIGADGKTADRSRHTGLELTGFRTTDGSA